MSIRGSSGYYVVRTGTHHRNWNVFLTQTSASEALTVSVQDGPGDFFAATVDHLFGGIWTHPGLTMRDREPDGTE